MGVGAWMTAHKANSGNGKIWTCANLLEWAEIHTRKQNIATQVETWSKLHFTYLRTIWNMLVLNMGSTCVVIFYFLVCPYGHIWISQPNINIDIWLRNRRFWNNNQPKINFSTTIQPKINQLSTKFQPFFNFDISTLNLVDFWLNCGWEVDFWLIIVSKSTISQPNINVEDSWGKLRLNVESTLIQRWEVDLCPLGYLCPFQ